MSLSLNVLHVARSIISSVMTSSNIIIIDNSPTIYTYTHEGVYEKHSALKGFKSYIHRYAAAATISSDGMYALICDASQERVLLFNLEKNSLTSQIKYAKIPDYCVFSENSSYFAIVNSIGRMNLYETMTCAQISELQVSDGVSSIAFSDDAKLLAIATFDKKMYLYNIEKKSLQSSFDMHENIEIFTFSKDAASILAFARSGNTYKIKHESSQITLVDSLSEWPSAISYTQNKDITLIGTRSNQLFIYTNTHGNNLGSITLDYWGISSVNLQDEKLFVGFTDSSGVIIDIQNLIADALSALESKDYALLCSIAYEHPLIFISKKFAEATEDHHADILHFKAMTYEEKKGHNALNSFILSATHKRQEMIQSVYTSKEFLTFMEHINSGQTTKACINAYNKPLLRQLGEFQTIRSGCIYELKTELKLLESNPKKLKEHIALMPRRCSKCRQGILPDLKTLEAAYKQLLLSVSAKNFPAVMSIVKKYPFFRQSISYRRLMYNGEALIDKTLIMIGAGKIAEAEKYATMLTRIKPFASTGADLMAQIKVYKTFLEACEQNNVEKVFSLIEEHPALRTTDDLKKEITKYKNKILTPALSLAKRGEVVKVKALISHYINVEYFQEKHFELFKLALAREIIIYAPFEKEQALLNSYHECFGWDEYYQEASEVLKCEANTSLKVEEISDECIQIDSFIEGEKIKRKTLHKEN